KLVLVSSGPFEDKYVAALQETRSSRLTLAERADFDRTLAALHDPAAGDKAALLARLGALWAKTDDYDPLDAEPVEGEPLDLQGELYQGVWEEAAAMRKSGRLLELACQIGCSVVAIHGDYDPHPASGVQEPLAAKLPDFRFILLPHCGHIPWRERHAGGE